MFENFQIYKKERKKIKINKQENQNRNLANYIDFIEI
jgi:hypothetical protein